MIAVELAREGVHLCRVAGDSVKLRALADSLVKMANIAVQVFPADIRVPMHPDRLLRRQLSISAVSTCWRTTPGRQSGRISST
jgi:short-subunit dehydrogenase